MTVDAAVTTARRVLAGGVGDGFRTPAGAFGADFVLELDGVDSYFDESTPTASSPVSPLLR